MAVLEFTLRQAIISRTINGASSVVSRLHKFMQVTLEANPNGVSTRFFDGAIQFNDFIFSFSCPS
jgi:hypothetical protein